MAREVVYRSLQLARGERVLACIRRLMESQWYSSEQLQENQWQDLAATLRHCAENVPYYRQQWASHGLSIERALRERSLSDFPILKKTDIRANSQLLRADTVHRSWVESTSGSTGTPFSFSVDSSMMSAFRAAKYRGHLWYGLQVGDKEARFYGIPMDGRGYRRERVKDWLLNRRRHSVFDMTDEGLRASLQWYRRFRPAYLYGYASALLRFAQFVETTGEDLGFEPKVAISTSEVLLPEHRTAIQRALGCPVANEYGASETGIIAFECPVGGMHIPAENVFVEVVDSEGNPTPPGSDGRVVVTELHNRAMPLIRYSLGDMVRMAKTPCSCGRGLPLLEVVVGRTNDFVRTPEGRLANGLIFYYVARSLLESEGGVEQFVVRQTALDSVTFQIVRTAEFRTASLDVLRDKTRAYLGESMRVEFEFVDEIPPHPAGKLMHFVSDLGENPAGSEGA